MFATIKGLIPEPRQADQPRNYIGRHRNPQVFATAPVPSIPRQAPDAGSDAPSGGDPAPDETPASDGDAEPVAACHTRRLQS